MFYNFLHLSMQLFDNKMTIEPFANITPFKSLALQLYQIIMDELILIPIVDDILVTQKIENCLFIIGSEQMLMCAHTCNDLELASPPATIGEWFDMVIKEQYTQLPVMWLEQEVDIESAIHYVFDIFALFAGLFVMLAKFKMSRTINYNINSMIGKLLSEDGIFTPSQHIKLKLAQLLSHGTCAPSFVPMAPNIFEIEAEKLSMVDNYFLEFNNGINITRLAQHINPSNTETTMAQNNKMQELVSGKVNKSAHSHANKYQFSITRKHVDTPAPANFLQSSRVLAEKRKEYEEKIGDASDDSDDEFYQPKPKVVFKPKIENKWSNLEDQLVEKKHFKRDAPRQPKIATRTFEKKRVLTFSHPKNLKRKKVE